MKLFSTTALAGALAGILLCTTPAAAQDVRSLLDRIERMERDMTTLQRQVYRDPGAAGASSTVITSPALGGGAPAAAAAPLPTDAAARIEVRLSNLEEQIRRLTGQVEENQFRNQQLKEQLDRLQADTDLRFRELQGEPVAATPAGDAPDAPAAEPAGGATTGVLGTIPQQALDRQLSAPPAPAPAAAATGELRGETAKDKYEYAYGLVMKDRDAAELALQKFIDEYPNDALTGNAYYWLGETYFVKGDFKQASVQFLDGYRKFPKSQKAAHNLLKLGMSLARADDVRSACAAFGKLQQEYPEAEATIKRTLQAERQRAKCP